MKIPALRAKIGNWDYYVTTLTFEQVDKFVSKVDENLHKSESLKDLIQRSITDNYKGVKEYIINQQELFFNSLVLAVYDDYPDWQEIEFKYDETETYQMGLLDFPSQHKIFPVDGQHRVEGIKAALKEKPELKDQQIAAIFIGHKNDDSGKQRTRRLFTTLNRYAKPVSPDYVIALEEDDVVAIMTRNLLEEYDLFTGKRVISAKQKAIPPKNKEAITSIITLYQANLELFKVFYEENFKKKPTKKVLDKYLKFKPSNEEFEAYKSFCIRFWDAFKTKLSFISEYVNTVENSAEAYRNNETGGNLLFRPIGILPFIKSSLLIYQRKQISFEQIFERFNNVNFEINTKPWLNVVWNPIEKKMIMNSDSVTQSLLIYLYSDNVLTAQEIKKLKEGYASKISSQDVDNVLQGIEN
ncbi:DGQHR domain-containing protein [Flexibacter flexilis DSM 6793]|uniref:DGQHR domain-containing protein n=1 Tax=Flexibacter flexilis DSM 6793 TaxID=927664 RepID=A0A1I1N7G4_9BACT|nr:DNA sulfur modification protein DndB [Flexibacter flexilis]SFC93385.1 DGQHR domain-containing protein [Flexibacter flexilis DSM 6793]